MDTEKTKLLYLSSKMVITKMQMRDKDFLLTETIARSVAAFLNGLLAKTKLKFTIRPEHVKPLLIELVAISGVLAMYGLEKMNDQQRDKVQRILGILNEPEKKPTAPTTPKTGEFQA